jgi:transcriptional regulator with XRE-family HTH domain
MRRKIAELKEEELHLHVGQELARKREELKLTQQQVGDAVGLSRTSICGIEGGDHKANLKELYKICIVLGVEPQQILPTIAAVTTDPPKFTMKFFGELKKVTRSEAKALRKYAKKLGKRK